jgi:signal peptidase
MHAASILIRTTRRTLDVLLIAVILVVLGTIVVARVIPFVTGGATFVVGGGSMEPAIPLGSVAIVTPVATSDLRVGDVVSVRVGREQSVFTHRIVRLAPRDDGLWIETKGDANAAPDPSIVPATTVIGRLAVGLPYAGYAVRVMSTAPGVLLVLAIGVLTLAAASLLEGLELDERVARREAARTSGILAGDAGVGEAAAG